MNEKCFGSGKNFVKKKCLGLKKFGDQKIRVKNILVQKILVQNDFGSEILLDPYRQPTKNLTETFSYPYQTPSRHTPDR